MKKLLLLTVLVFSFSFSSQAQIASRGNWLFGGGLGVTLSPELFLLNMQLEKVSNDRLSWGPLLQVAPGSGGVLFTGSIGARYIIGNHKRFKPSFEGGVGLALASSIFADSIGVHIYGGMGFEYIVEPGLSLGTMIRANFAPPLKTFFLSWPIAMVRFAL